SAPQNIVPMYIDQLVRPARDRYRAQMLAQLCAPISLPKLQLSIDAIVSSNGALQVALREMTDQVPEFVTIDGVKLIVQQIDADVGVEEILKYPRNCKPLRAFFDRPLDLTKAPLAHAALLNLSDGAQVFLLDMHRAIADTLGCFIFLQQLDTGLAGTRLPAGTSFSGLTRRLPAYVQDISSDELSTNETTLPEDCHGNKGVSAQAVTITLDWSLWRRFNALAAQNKLSSSIFSRMIFEFLLGR